MRMMYSLPCFAPSGPPPKEPRGGMDGIRVLASFPLWPWLTVGLPFLLLPRARVRA